MVLLASGCADKPSPEEIESIYTQAKILHNVCANNVENYNNAIEGSNYDINVATMFINSANSACERYRKYVEENIDVLDYNERGERDNWGTNELVRLDKNRQVYENWNENMKNKDSGYFDNPPITSDSTPTITPKPISNSPSDIYMDHLLDALIKCYKAHDEALADANKFGYPPTNKLNYAISACDQAVIFYEQLPIGVYKMKDGNMNFDVQFKRDYIETARAIRNYLYDMLNPEDPYYITGWNKPSPSEIK